MYVLDRDRQVSLIREMTQLRKNNKNLEVYYHHPSTNAMWKSYFPKAKGEARGPKILRTEPVPDSLTVRLENCLAESEPENAVGLGIELSAKPEQWVRIMSILEENYRQYDRKQLSLFLKNLGVENYESLFNEIDCDFQSLDITKDTLDKLARRSKIIRFKRFFWF